ncbi:hypothetical protein ESZ36_01225 [Colwellia demingiae]|uniref:Uncharacterized protein n=1 Tax=Colwellia demingiae TaxID=89401 RepID=A0A5C6QT74_9GAMM|nr:hypothetical protein [Colwellia demingiae]TWX71883.1 hypothetical protein ESZ36_01225 [Colwellia demingiae]
MPDLTVEEFSLKEAITSLRVLESRIEKFSISAFLFFSLASLVALTNNSIEINGLNIQSSMALVIMFVIGVFCFVCRTLSLLGTQVYIEKVKELHIAVYPKDKGKHLSSLWSFSPLSTLALFTVIKATGCAGHILKPIIAIGFLSPVVFSLFKILQAGYFNSLVKLEPIAVVFFLSCLLLMASYLLEGYIVKGDFSVRTKKALDSMVW